MAGLPTKRDLTPLLWIVSSIGRSGTIPTARSSKDHVYGKSADDDSVDQRSNYVRGSLSNSGSNNRTCQLKIKGSPTSKRWYGENGSSTADGYVCLLRLPDSCPLAKLPNRYTMPEKIVTSLATPTMTAFFNENGRSKAHQDLLTMASDYAVPCIRRATEQDMSGARFTAANFSSMSGG